MNKFKYRAIRTDGRILEKEIFAPSEQQALQQIRDAQLFPLELFPVKERQKNSKALNLEKLTIPAPVRIQFTKSLYTLTKAGIPILGALKVLLEQAENETLETIIKTCIGDISNGKSFFESLLQFPRVFSPLYVQSIQVGEYSGTFEDTLKYLAQLEEKEYRLKKELKNSLRYPAFTLLAIVIAFVIFTTVVFPQFVPLFEATQVSLPLPTRVLMGLSVFFQQYWWLIVLSLGALATAVFRYWQLPHGRKEMERLVFRLPILGKLIQLTMLTRYTKMLHTLFKAGVPILQAVEIVKDGIHSEILKSESEQIIHSLSKGERFTEYLEQSDIFDPFTVKMLRIGEESGALEGMLEYVSQFLEKEAEEMIEQLNTILEPVLTVGLGIMVIFLALSLFLPMWNLMGNIR